MFSPMTSSLEKSRDFENRVNLKNLMNLKKSHEFENSHDFEKSGFFSDRVTAPPRPDSPSGTFPQKYNLRSHVIDIE